MPHGFFNVSPAEYARAVELAGETLALARNTLLIRLRFLDAAINRLQTAVHAEIAFASDGNCLYYEPFSLLKRYKVEPGAMNRDLLHVLLHSLLRHPWFHTDRDRAVWDLACDVAVEVIAAELGFPAARDEWQRPILAELRREVRPLTAELIERTDEAGRHELTAWLLEYRKNTFPDAIDGKPVTSVAIRNFFGQEPRHVDRLRRLTMNIKDAKQQIKNTITAYLSKNEYGEYAIPLECQRPVFLMGPPGIGKTAIMEQIAQELGVGLVSYSMTHHTRQSALGLPFIVKKNYGGREYDVSEYTMSEIIASVYDTMEESGVREGILFLDEINCVSETLTPAMLQFLQYKIFGRHRVPEGWTVVTAGNPLEYNNSVRAFDIVTWDRLKRIDVDPDYSAWKEYALNMGVHPAVTTYLEIKKGDFYSIESTVDGKRFATARGWSDLSEMLKLYEKLGIPADECLVAQYLQNPRIARDFAVYYDLWGKYRSEYQVEQILNGTAGEAVLEKAKAARFDERLSLLGLLLGSVTEELKNVCMDEQILTELAACFKGLRMALMAPGTTEATAVEAQINARLAAMEAGKRAGSLAADARHIGQRVIKILEEVMSGAVSLRQIIETRRTGLKTAAAEAGAKLENLFAFCTEAFGEGQEMQILVTELTISTWGSKFISRYGCKAYYAHNQGILLDDRTRDLLAQIDELTMPLK